MKTTKKILFVVLALMLVLTVVFGAVACKDTKEPQSNTSVQLKEIDSLKISEDGAVVITLDKTVMADVTGKHLVDYMNALKDQGYFVYEEKSGLVTSVMNIKPQASNEYWFLYTDDEENSSTQWGQYDAGDKTYGSANYGITDLPLKEGKTYIFKIGVSNW